MTAVSTTICTTLALAAACAGGSAQAAPVAGQGTWQSTLAARDINGDGTVDAFHDETLNVTWLADANAAVGSAFDTALPGSGLMNWASARAWAAQLNVYGVTGWRLPTMLDTGAPGCDFSYSGTDCGFGVQDISADSQTVYSELAHLYFVTLGNRP